MTDQKMIFVEVAFALPQNQKIIGLDVPEGTTVFEAAEKSGITQVFPLLDLDKSDMGVFGKVVKDPKSQVLLDGQRVEIYRPLTIDPKVARANRAAKAKEKAEKAKKKQKD